MVTGLSIATRLVVSGSARGSPVKSLYPEHIYASGLLRNEYLELLPLFMESILQSTVCIIKVSTCDAQGQMASIKPDTSHGRLLSLYPSPQV